MKKFFILTAIVSALALVIDWGVMGVKILNHDYQFTAEAYIALICIILLFICGIYRIARCRCPHCGRLLMTGGSYCPYCGKSRKG